MNRLSKKLTAVVGAFAMAIAGASLMTNSAIAEQQDKPAKAAVGSKAPDFTLTSVDGKSYTLSELTKQGKIVVLEWWNPKCPFVVKHHEHASTMKDLAQKYKDKGVVWLAINSTNPDHGNHGVDADYIKKWEVKFPVLLDESGDVGRMYDARTTPHMYIIDTNGVLRYQGAIDSDRGARIPSDPSTVTNYVAQALDQILAGETVTQPETRPYGCSVKYVGVR